MPLDPNVPPHKTKVFWYVVALAIVLAVAYPLAARSHGPLWFDIVPSVITSVMLICIGWFTVRRLQRDLARGIQPNIRPSGYRVIILAIAFILFVLASLMRRHSPPQKQFRPAEEKPDYVKKLEEWKP